MKTKLILALACLSLMGCLADPNETKPTDNPQIKVELLFTQDGVRVYRFEDGNSRHVYFTTRGETSWDEPQGKSSIRMQVNGQP